MTALAVAAAVLEVALRSLGPFLPGSYQTSPLIEPDGTFGWHNVKGASAWLRRGDVVTRVEVNTNGRFGPNATEDFADRCRVLFLGDSYLAALHVPYEQSVAALIPTLLAGDKIEAVNEGVPGYGTDQELLLLEQRSSELRPDVVVVLFSIANDVWNNYWPFESRRPIRGKPHFAESESGEMLLLPGPAVGTDERIRSLLSASEVLNVVRTGVLDHAASIGLRRQQLEVLSPPEGEWVRAWKVTEGIVRRLGSWSGSTGIPILLVVNPDPCQLYSDQCAGTRNTTTSTPQRLLSDIAVRSGLGVLDLLPAFSRAAPERHLYLQGDIHWSAAGHEVAAEAIVDRLRSVGPLRATCEFGERSG